MKKYTITLETLLVEEVEAETEDEAKQEAIERVNMETNNACDWIVTDIEAEEI